MNFVEVCAGAGGLVLGFVMEGFEPLLFNLNEIDANCCGTLRMNHLGYSDRVAMCDISSLDLSGLNSYILMGRCACHPLETRPLIVREYARIQTFPQIGNAVNMARHHPRSFKCV